MLEFGDIVTLENDEEYLVASSCEYQSEIYIYLVNMKNSADCILAIVKNDELEQVIDVDVFNKVIPLILDNANEEILNEEDVNE